MKFPPVEFIALLLALSGCVSPVRVRNEVSALPSPCRYRTVTLIPQTESIPAAWLADPENPKAVENVLKKEFQRVGLTPVAGGAGADLTASYSVAAQDRTPLEQPEGVIMASPYRQGTLFLDVLDAQRNQVVWKLRVDGVISNMRGRNMDMAAPALRKGLAPLSGCTK